MRKLFTFEWLPWKQCRSRTLAFVGRAALLPTCFYSRQVPLASDTWNLQGPLSHGYWNLGGLIFAPVSAPGLVSGFEQWLLFLEKSFSSWCLSVPCAPTLVSFAGCLCRGSQQWAVRAPQTPQESFPALPSGNLKSFWGIFKHCFVVKKLSFLSSEYTQLLKVYLHELWNRRNLVFYRSQEQKLISEFHKRKNLQNVSFASTVCRGILMVPVVLLSKVPSGVSPPTWVLTFEVLVEIYYLLNSCSPSNFDSS